METHANATTTAQAEAIVANPTVRERVTTAAKRVKLSTRTTLAVGGCLLIGGAYWLFTQRYGSPMPEVVAAE